MSEKSKQKTEKTTPGPPGPVNRERPGNPGGRRTTGSNTEKSRTASHRTGYGPPGAGHRAATGTKECSPAPDAGRYIREGPRDPVREVRGCSPRPGLLAHGAAGPDERGDLLPDQRPWLPARRSRRRPAGKRGRGMTRGRRPLRALTEAVEIAGRRGSVENVTGRRGHAFDFIIIENFRVVFVKVKRSQTLFTYPREALFRYEREIASLHRVALTLVTAREFWSGPRRGVAVFPHPARFSDRSTSRRDVHPP